ncbi:hypothetical protein [Scleromatobacter humisilvae]|uniref:Uncharacterized protein n=1 Tax=Scleromatobacter humisilvae TaxID=2897159 RepID=A0A9X1YJH0_9BURK|nr:hypothetical protein [Scleromatobacter humisilvae]MCK9687293.1 hypothetical protein [Scleromatobacter humisilvae]
MDVFDRESDVGADEFDDPTAGPVATPPATPSAPETPIQVAAPVVVAPAPARESAPLTVSNGIPDAIAGVELRRGAEQVLADIDKIALVELLEPSMLTEYLTRTVGQYQAVVDVDARPSHAITALMRQALLVVLASQKIAGKSVAVAGQLNALEPKLEAYLFTGGNSVVGRLQTVIDTIVPASRKLLEDILVDVDRFVFKLVKAHVDAAVDGHELVERRRDAERLTSERDVALSRERDAKDRLAEYKEMAEGKLAAVTSAGARLAWMSCGFGILAGALMAFAVVHFAR